MNKNKIIIVIMIAILGLFGFTKVNAADKDYSKLSFTQVTNGSTPAEISKYYYYHHEDGYSGDIIAHTTPKGTEYHHQIPAGKTGSTDENCIYFALNNADVSKVTINGEEVDFYKNAGALAYVPLDLFKNEYSEIIIFTSDNSIITKVIINNKNVTEAKADASHKADELSPEGASDAVKELVKKAKEDIEKAEDKETVDKILDELQTQIEVQEAKEKALADLDELIGENPSDEVTELYDAAKTEINDQTSKENVEKALAEAKDKIELQQVKENALSDLVALLGENPSDEVSKLNEEAINEINDATSKEDVEKILTEAKDKIELQQTKENAIATLTELLGKKYSNSLKNIYDKALSKIEEATSKEDVEKILKEAEKDITDQIKKEEQEAKGVKNPITLDSILTSFLTLGTSSALITMSIKKSRLLKR